MPRHVRHLRKVEDQYGLSRAMEIASGWLSDAPQGDRSPEGRDVQRLDGNRESTGAEGMRSNLIPTSTQGNN
jgi:hypothetical protein